jgi:hypothetical protein
MRKRMIKKYINKKRKKNITRRSMRTGRSWKLKKE